MSSRIPLLTACLAGLLLPPALSSSRAETVPAEIHAARGATLPGLADLRVVRSPAAAGSASPSLAVGPDGRVWLTWLERRPRGGHALRGARLEHARWSRPFTIAEGDSFFANWADFPTLLPRGADHLVAHYPWKVGDATYAYEVRLTQSHDGGRTWSPPVVPHRDGTPTEHGFVSLVPAAGGARAVWLDGRNAVRDSGGHHLHVGEGMAEMTLRSAVLAPDGSLAEEALLDPRVCDCCQTAAVATPGGALVAYRDRSPEEIRDISLVRLEEPTGWSEPYPLHADGWRIHGCPVNGPVLASHGDRIAVAWYTAAGDSFRVLTAFSQDGGRSFGVPLRVDEGAPLGRVHLALLADGDALVTWLEARGSQALVQVRRVRRDGVLSAAATVAQVSAARASGFPRIVRAGEQVVLAWTEGGKPNQVRTAVARVPAPSMR